MSSTGNTKCASWVGVVCVGREVEVTAGMYWTAGCEEAGTQAEEAWDVSDGDLSTPEGVELELVTSDLGETGLHTRNWSCYLLGDCFFIRTWNCRIF